MHIPVELIPDAYQVSKKVLEKKITSEEGADRLTGKNKMVRGSASIYITVFLQLMQGKKITYTLNAQSIEYCLDHILLDFGTQRFLKALSSLKLHIDYCEKKSNGKMGKLRAIYEEKSKHPLIKI